jgi:hypothetical protein
MRAIPIQRERERERGGGRERRLISFFVIPLGLKFGISWNFVLISQRTVSVHEYVSSGNGRERERARETIDYVTSFSISFFLSLVNLTTHTHTYTYAERLPSPIS